MGVVPWEMSSHLDSATIIHKICLHRALLFLGGEPTEESDNQQKAVSCSDR